MSRGRDQPGGWRAVLRGGRGEGPRLREGQGECRNWDVKFHFTVAETEAGKGKGLVFHCHGRCGEFPQTSGVRPGACTLPQFGSLEAKREGSAGPRALRAPGKNPSLTGSGFQLAAAPCLRLPVYTRPPSPLHGPSALRPSAENTRDHMEGLAG